MQNYLQKAIKLAKKTGDRLIIFDTNEPENTMVLIPVNDYEKLIIGRSEVRGLTEDELLDKINRDIAIWKSDNEFQENQLNNKNFLNKNNNLTTKRFEEDFGDFSEEEEDDLFYYEDEEEEEGDDEKDYNLKEAAAHENEEQRLENRGNLWRIPKDVEASAEEII